MQRLKEFLRTDRCREMIVYLIAGVLTTLVNYIVYFLITRSLAALTGSTPDAGGVMLAGNVVAWICAVAFAFWSNKKYVFRSAGWDRATLRRELPGFIAARLFSLLFDIGFVYLAVRVFSLNDLIAKLLSNVLVIVINYFLSRFWIFRRKDPSGS